MKFELNKSPFSPLGPAFFPPLFQKYFAGDDALEANAKC